ncbi:hypothetical protein GCM10007036_31160 [Alsobacter metallidurans]|uniref:Uncharacterized protein n=2 Tax=Alsobacter metallidurans TaxID=340221 RepID=A0A917I9V7_9HYPH|nr:hypothetical protein GCM10007036_31160 [Alsobacter metallidurans]
MTIMRRDPLDLDTLLAHPDMAEQGEHAFSEFASILALAERSRQSGFGDETRRGNKPGGHATHQRDLDRALSLVGRASTLLERSDRRIRTIESEAAAGVAALTEELTRARAKVRDLEQQVAEAEVRIKEADGRIAEAECRLQSANDWVHKLHDAITRAFSAYEGTAANR